MLTDSSVAGTNPVGSAGFGSTITFGVTVPGPAGGAAATGTVRFSVDGTLIGAAPLAAGRVNVVTSALLPGTHAIAVSYSGDGTFLPGGVSITHVVTCGATLRGNQKGVSVSGAGSVCLLGATLSGALNIGSKTNVAVVNSSIPVSSLSAKGSGQVMVCGSTVGGSISVSGSLGLVVIGDPGHSLCGGNSVQGAISVQDDLHGVMVRFNRSTNVVTKNLAGTGAYPVFGDRAPDIVGNHT